MRLYIINPMKTQQKGNIARSVAAAVIWEPRRSEILAEYVNGLASQMEMAALYGVTLAGFQRAIKRMGIPAKSRGRPGPANGRFKDGAKSTAYRKMVDKRQCNRCPATDNLVVHHIDGVHTNNTPSNLEVLCSPCHSSHHKQEWWDARRASAS